MIKKYIEIENIPAILWGNKSDELILVVHGNMSHKEDDIVITFSKEATARGYQVLSFDLPEHGERKNESYPCKFENCIQDLNKVMCYAKMLTVNISLFACSMGAYFSFFAYKNEPLKKSLLLSPVINMESIIDKMMLWFNVSLESLQLEKEIVTSNGQKFYWDDYSYVKENTIVDWNIPTSIIYGSEDELCSYEVLNTFSKKFNCDIEILEHGEHFFYTDEQLQFFTKWLNEHI